MQQILCSPDTFIFSSSSSSSSSYCNIKLQFCLHLYEKLQFPLFKSWRMPWIDWIILSIKFYGILWIWGLKRTLLLNWGQNSPELMQNCPELRHISAKQRQNWADLKRNRSKTPQTPSFICFDSSQKELKLLILHCITKPHLTWNWYKLYSFTPETIRGLTYE